MLDLDQSLVALVATSDGIVIRHGSAPCALRLGADALFERRL